MLRAVKIRLYPNSEQTEMINRLLGCSRYVYNALLALKTKEYNENGNNLSFSDLSHHYHSVMCKDSETSWLKGANTKVIKQTIRHLVTAYDNFFKHKAKFPNFKSKKNKNSVTFPIGAISKKNTFETRHITLTKLLKDVKFKCSDLSFRRIRENKDYIRSATLTRTKSGKFELSILIDFQNPYEFRKFDYTGCSVGVDLGVKDFAVTSDGEVFENIHPFKNSERRIKKLHKQLSKKKKGSNNRWKLRKKIRKLYERDTMRKNDMAYKLCSLLSGYQVIMQDEQLRAWKVKHGKKVQHSILGRVKERLMSIPDTIVLHRFVPTTKLCRDCGAINDTITIRDREFVCPNCGVVYDRDIHAAENMLWFYENIIGVERTEFKPVDFKERIRLFFESLKQEASESSVQK